MLKIKFLNKSGVPDDQVFITPFSVNPAFSATAGNGTALQLYKSITLKDIGADGISLNTIIAGRFFVSFNLGWQNTLNGDNKMPEPSPVSTVDKWFHISWDKFEITMQNNDGDQANLTSIDFVGIPMALESQSNGTPVQQIGYPEGSQIMTNLAKINPNAIVKNAQGNTVRILGPTQNGYPSIGGWQSFASYVDMLKKNNQSTKIKFQTAFSVDKETNWMYFYEFDAIPDKTENKFVMKGTLKATNTINSKSVNPSGELSIEIAGDEGANTFFSSFIYAGVGNTDAKGKSNVTFSGDWAGFFAQTIPDHIKEVQKRIIGDLAVGLAYGFAGSEKFGDKTSGEWFAAGQREALSDIQPDSAFYSVYENAIFHESGRTLYGHPYSDRMSAYAVAVDSVKHEGKPIDTLVVTIFNPNPAPPQPVGEATHHS